ncbi:MAG TPA: exodeoxyribonuclease III [Burkholderiales bacterium]|nr:exodeoxyribonuclease III [Burkholderiales bacterium]
MTGAGSRFRLATWNVNSLKVRLPHLLGWLAAAQPDALCLQETKTEDANFPVAELEAAGYRAVFCGQKAYNGVAILARTDIAEVQHGIPQFADEPKRVIAATVNACGKPLRVISIYAPNGQALASDKYVYKLKWYEALAAWLKDELARRPDIAVLGDFNVAPEDRDVHNPKRWEGSIHVSEPERAAFRRLLEVGFADAFRLFPQPEKEFSWWDYRLLAFQRGWGLRIDEILLSPQLAQRCISCTIDKAPRGLERPSDHAPVLADLA